jgi:hypothetical protein
MAKWNYLIEGWGPTAQERNGLAQKIRFAWVPRLQHVQLYMHDDGYVLILADPETLSGDMPKIISKEGFSIHPLKPGDLREVPEGNPPSSAAWEHHFPVVVRAAREGRVWLLRHRSR